MAKRCAASGALQRASRAFCDELAQGASAKTVWGSLRAEQVPSRAARWMRPRSDPEYRKRRSDTGQATEKSSRFDYGAALSARAAGKIDPDAERWVAQLKTAIEACRTLRGEIQLPPGARAPLFASGDEALLTAFAPYMRALARLSDVRHCADESALNQAASGAPVAFAGALKMALKADTDPVAERARLDKEIRRIEAELSKCRVKLSNEAFVSKAPEVIVGQERKRASEYEAVRDALIAQRA